jgi:cytochrome c biogenesis protein CcdA
VVELIKPVGWRPLILVLFLLPFLFSSPPAQAGSTVTVHIFGYESSVTDSLIGYLSELNCEVILHSLNESSPVTYAERIVELLELVGVEAAQQMTANTSACKRCEIPLSLYARSLLVQYASPLIGFFRNGKLTTITMGVTEPEILTKALSTASSGEVKVFTLSDEYSVTDESIRAVLENFFLEQAESKVTVPSIVLTVSLLAIADSVNPCTFAVFTALLFIALRVLSRTKAALTGFAFITAVFLCYYALGLGLIQILVAIPYVDKIVALVGLAIGAFSIARGLKPKFKSPIPKSIRIFIETHIARSYVSPMLSFVLGGIVSFTLLPCSVGPYIVSLGLLSALNNPFQAYLLLALYNTLFVTPLILVLFVILISRLGARKIKALKSTKLGIMELINGSILLIICIYIILSP